MIKIMVLSDAGHESSLTLFRNSHNDIIPMQNGNQKAIENFTVMAETLRAAAHAERLAILNMLWLKNAMHVKSIYSSLKLEQSVVSRHLGILKRCGILIKTGSGTNSIYSLNMENPITLSMIQCLQHA